jgi:CheY-like chemotaxis protein
MSQQKPRVLVVDDDLVYRFAAIKTIAATGLAEEIVECNNGQEGINFLEQNLNNPEKIPDIIFLDLNMPIMNGWDFLKAFERLAPQIAKPIHIYIVTSSIDKNDVVHSKEFTAVNDYVVKPVFKETFKQILSAVKV